MKHICKLLIVLLIMLSPVVVFAETTTTAATTTTSSVATTTISGHGRNTNNSGCPLGEQVTKDLSGALRVMKILAPIFMFAYTIFDAIVAVTKGDIEAEGKKLLGKFLKRLAATLALFAIPVLIDVLMQLFNVWDETGHCSFNSAAVIQVIDK